MRSGRAPWLLAALVWVLVVAAVGSVTYLVVDRAGRGIGDTSQTRPLAVAPSTTPTPSPTQSSPRPSRTPSRTSSPSASPRPTASTASTATPTRTPPAPPAPTRTTAAPPASSTRSFATAGGTVVATCTDGVVRLDSITVRDGWRFETEKEEGYLEVKFESAGDDEVELKIGCRGGVPVQVDH